jgi:hypothetical protein
MAAGPNKALERTRVNVAKIVIDFVFVSRSESVLASQCAAQLGRYTFQQQYWGRGAHGTDSIF